MRRTNGMKKLSSTFIVGWSPLQLLLLLLLQQPIAIMMMAVIPNDKLSTQKTVGQLMADSTIKFDLVKYFTDLELQNSCLSPLINEKDFPKSLTLHYESSMCTIIYNITKELEIKTVNVTNNLTKTVIDTNYKSSDMYTVWKNVSNISKSPSLNLLMKQLNETKKWNSVCYNFNNNLFPYCKFLHSEILLLQTILHVNESIIKSNAPVNESSKIDKSTPFDLTSENSKVIMTAEPENLDPNDNRDLFNDENEIDDPSKINDFDNEKQSDVLNPNEPKIAISNDKNQNENLNTIVPTDTKIASPVFSSSNKLTNHQDESHFLFYFIIMTVLSMMFYLALYNKKKIIALLIEGRRSTNHRRRPNSTSYAKVETDDGNSVY